MADVPLTQALIVIAQNYAGDIVRQINRTSVFLKLLAPTFRPMEGKNAAWVAEGDGAVAESFASGADPANFGSDSQTSATIPHARYWAPFHVNGDAMAAAASSRTPAGNVQLWKRQMENGAEKLAKLLNTDLYVGAGGNDLVGLDAAIGTTNNTYATIDRTVGANSFWIPNVFAPVSATALTFDLVRSDLSAIKTASGYKPDFAMVSSLTLNKLSALFDPQKQYVFQTNVDVVNTASGLVTLDGGVGALKFDGCTFIEDSFTPANSIYYCNSRYMRIEYLDAANSVIPFGGGDTMIGGLSDGFDTIPLGTMLEVLAKTGDSQKAYLKVYPQLVVERPNAFGKRSNIA
ncbi:phage major capsid protein [Sorangium sp. So ce1014]|uniref:phage major capsid protein n=1 Tax=Sorangium sp. So ce1014 TaxID=3133326 RepID=UPI003F5F1295